MSPAPSSGQYGLTSAFDSFSISDSGRPRSSKKVTLDPGIFAHPAMTMTSPGSSSSSPRRGMALHAPAPDSDFQILPSRYFRDSRLPTPGTSSIFSRPTRLGTFSVETRRPQRSIFIAPMSERNSNHSTSIPPMMMPEPIVGRSGVPLMYTPVSYSAVAPLMTMLEPSIKRSGAHLTMPESTVSCSGAPLMAMPEPITRSMTMLEPSISCSGARLTMPESTVSCSAAPSMTMPGPVTRSMTMPEPSISHSGTVPTFSSWVPRLPPVWDQDEVTSRYDDMRSWAQTSIATLSPEESPFLSDQCTFVESEPDEIQPTMTTPSREGFSLLSDPESPVGSGLGYEVQPTRRLSSMSSNLGSQGMSIPKKLSPPMAKPDHGVLPNFNRPLPDLSQSSVPSDLSSTLPVTRTSMVEVVLYTSTDNHRQLTKPVEIILTLTPEDKRSSDNYLPLVLKVLEFQKKSLQKARIRLEQSFGFAIAQQDLDSDIVIAGDMRAPCSFDSVVSFRDGVLKSIKDQPSFINGNHLFRLLNGEYDELTAVLCMIDNSNPDSQVYRPVAQLKDLKEDIEYSYLPPIMLQAYAVSGSRYQVGMPLAESDKENFLFADLEGKPRAIDIRRLVKAQRSFSSSKFTTALEVRLYSSRSGRVVTDTIKYDDLLGGRVIM